MNVIIAKEVKDAVFHGNVVALESTVLSHGLPWPQNYESYKQMAQSVFEKGAVPACIGIINGQPVVGLNEEQILILCQEKNIIKASTKDIAYACASGRHAATTVAATMYLANIAGIKVFATGGIGGVHKNSEKTFDISADLIELSRTPVIVVSAGAKAILDVPATIEHLETLAVPVIGYKTEYFPCFWCPNSPYSVDITADNAAEIAKIYKCSEQLGLHNGFLVANPIPTEYAIPFEKVEKWVNDATEAAMKRNISGKSVTPFLLSYIADLTKGESVKSNLELLNSNCRLAAEIACAL